MKKTNRVNIYILLFLCLHITSCTKSSTETSPSSPPPINTNEITYELNVEPIISRECKGCHSGSSASAGLRLENYNQVRSSTENGDLLERINDISNPMPQSGLMNQSNRDIIENWSKNNFLEN